MAEKKIIIKRIKIKKPIHLEDNQERLVLKESIAELCGVKSVDVEMLFEDKSFKVGRHDKS